MDPANNIEQQTLAVISKAGRFNRWMYDTVSPYCHGRILEIGSGIGNISSFFVRDNFDITLSDIGDDYLEQLRDKFDNITNVRSILRLDLQQDNFHDAYQEIENFFDTIFLLNVLEHIGDDERAILNCKILLKKGGTLIVLVPAHPWLYARLDKELHHHRRYSLQQLKTLFNKTGLTVKKQFYFNASGIFAWMYAKILGLSVVPQREMNGYDKIVPAAKVFDKISFGKIGLSAIIVGEK